MLPIKMVDLHGQYLHIKKDVDAAIQSVLDQTDFIQGSAVKYFESALSSYMGGAYTISCGNGTDALQIAMMALDFKEGDEIILPVHTYVATAEVIALLKLIPVFVDVDPISFTLDLNQTEKKITRKTVAIVPVHLYGQCADMAPLMNLANKHKLHVIEDVAQALGADYISNGTKKAGTIGIVGSTSFFPSKNLGAYGDGGALFTLDAALAEKMKMIANHGQKKKYHHDVIGINSRLDTLQAAILGVKLSHLDSYAQKRRDVADHYDKNLSDIKQIVLPARMSYSTHVFHQYTIVVNGTDRDAFKLYLQEKGIPSMIYYPVPLHFQKAYKKEGFGPGSFPVSEQLSKTVLSLPIHTEMGKEQLSYICHAIRNFF